MFCKTSIDKAYTLGRRAFPLKDRPFSATQKTCLEHDYWIIEHWQGPLKCKQASRTTRDAAECMKKTDEYKLFLQNHHQFNHTLRRNIICF